MDNKYVLYNKNVKTNKMLIKKSMFFLHQHWLTMYCCSRHQYAMNQKSGTLARLEVFGTLSRYNAHNFVQKPYVSKKLIWLSVLYPYYMCKLSCILHCIFNAFVHGDIKKEFFLIRSVFVILVGIL